MSEAPHTPTPWKACGANNGGCKCGLIWAESADQCVMTANCVTCDVLEHGDAAPPVEVMKANVRFVVRAVNSHYDLLAVCKKLDEIDCCHGYELNQNGYRILWDALNMVRTALEKLEVK